MSKRIEFPLPSPGLTLSCPSAALDLRHPIQQAWTTSRNLTCHAALGDELLGMTSVDDAEVDIVGLEDSSREIKELAQAPEIQDSPEHSDSKAPSERESSDLQGSDMAVDTTQADHAADVDAIQPPVHAAGSDVSILKPSTGNPQMKKACLTVRAQHVERLSETGDLPLSMLPLAGNQSTSGALPPRRTSSSERESQPVPRAKRQRVQASASASPEAKPPVDTFATSLGALMVPNSPMIAPEHVQGLQTLFASTDGQKRNVLLDVLRDFCSAEVMDAFVHGSGLQTLGEWLVQGLARDQLEFARKVLQALAKLPVDIDALRNSNIGRTLTRLRKTAPEELRASIAGLLASWKKLVQPAAEAPKAEAAAAVAPVAVLSASAPTPAAASGSAADEAPPTPTAAAAGKRPREEQEQSQDEGPSKAAKVAADSSSAATKKSSVPTKASQETRGAANGLLTKTSLDGAGKAASTAPLRTILGAADAHAPSRAGGRLVAMTDDSMFRSSRPANLPRPSGRSPLVPTVHKAHTLKMLDTDSAKELGKQRLRDGKGGDPGSPSARSKEAPAQEKTPVTSAPVVRNIIGGTTRIGGPIFHLPSDTAHPAAREPAHQPSAAERARMAAEKVPDPAAGAPPAPRTRRKTTTVSWAGDHNLVGIRWFLKTDPAGRVRADDDAMLPEEVPEGGIAEELPQAQAAPEVEVPPHRQFMQAAQREHWGEAAALRQLAEEDEDDDHLAFMEGHDHWMPPPHVDAPPQEDPVGTGEESEERQIQAARRLRTPAAVYPTPDRIPDTAGEGPSLNAPFTPSHIIPQIAWHIQNEGQGDQQPPPGPSAVPAPTLLPAPPSAAPSPAPVPTPAAPPQGVPTVPPELALALANLATAQQQQQQPSAGQPTPLPQQITLDTGQLQALLAAVPAAAAAPQASGPAAAKGKPAVMRNTYGSQAGAQPAAVHEPAAVAEEEPQEEPSYGFSGERGRRGGRRGGARGFPSAARGMAGRGERGRGRGRICAYFNSEQGCRKGVNCDFMHVQEGNVHHSGPGAMESASHRPGPPQNAPYAPDEGHEEEAGRGRRAPSTNRGAQWRQEQREQPAARGGGDFRGGRGRGPPSSRGRGGFSRRGGARGGHHAEESSRDDERWRNKREREDAFGE
ncbi:hypothetical protein WJX73_003212 [Symbiochloris irregularis]|uniref:Serine/threonine-protein phosphatase 1 regulatory subunit 10 n=1 Tax=Symbiochloris irregularis TaxID=706552 RepID=A0AAW1Q373_9CHLO